MTEFGFVQKCFRAFALCQEVFWLVVMYQWKNRPKHLVLHCLKSKIIYFPLLHFHTCKSQEKKNCTIVRFHNHQMNLHKICIYLYLCPSPPSTKIIWFSLNQPKYSIKSILNGINGPTNHIMPSILIIFLYKKLLNNI